MPKTIKKPANKLGLVLSFLGFGFCYVCGEKLKLIGHHGYYNDPIFECGNCKKRR